MAQIPMQQVQIPTENMYLGSSITVSVSRQNEGWISTNFTKPADISGYTLRGFIARTSMGATNIWGLGVRYDSSGAAVTCYNATASATATANLIVTPIYERD